MLKNNEYRYTYNFIDRIMMNLYDEKEFFMLEQGKRYTTIIHESIHNRSATKDFREYHTFAQSVIHNANFELVSDGNMKIFRNNSHSQPVSTQSLRIFEDNLVETYNNPLPEIKDNKDNKDNNKVINNISNNMSFFSPRIYQERQGYENIKAQILGTENNEAELVRSAFQNSH